MEQTRRLYNDSEPLWYKDALIYQLHVKSFCDSTADGMGDFRGLTQKLDYLESLGITAIWLLPFYPSPLKDDGYDIADYYNIHAAYGRLRDFKKFLNEAHRRGIRVIIELVLNHTSDQHEWFLRARTSPPGSAARNVYVWSDTPDRYRDARIIFKDFEKSNWAWDPVAEQYYWHRFYSHQPDLNFENERVHQALFKIIDYWFAMGVDGMRLDAVPYLYEQEGTNCENLPLTYAFLKKLRAHVDATHPNRMLLAEANQWPEDAAAYFGNGDMCHMAFHFPLMPRIFMALQMENSFPILDIMEQTPQIPDTAQWGIFLRNHDELTLEMVTDEERDYMYRYYAQDPVARINLGIRRRLAPLLRNSRRRIEILNILLFSLPGTPIIYYGDEIGMGDNHYLGDRNGVRTPMQWSADRNAGFSTANPQKLYLPVIIDPEYHYESINVENQEKNVSSLLWWMRRVIAMRRKHHSFARGEIEFVHSDNSSVISFIRKYNDEVILVIVNLSRFSQVVSLDLRSYAGYTPIDIFSNNKFPVLKERPYVLTMGFHTYFWLILTKGARDRRRQPAYLPPNIETGGDWRMLFETPLDSKLETVILPPYLEHRLSTATAPVRIMEIEIADVITMATTIMTSVVLVLHVQYGAGISDTFILPLTIIDSQQHADLIRQFPECVIAHLSGAQPGILFDCSRLDDFHQVLYRCIGGRREMSGRNGVIRGNPSDIFRRKYRKTAYTKSHIMKAGEKKTSFAHGADYHFKLFHRVEEGINPDVEMLAFIDRNRNPQVSVPDLLGSLEYRKEDATSAVIGILTSFIKNTGSAWGMVIDTTIAFFEEVLANRDTVTVEMAQPLRLLAAPDATVPPTVTAMAGILAAVMETLGQKTAYLHGILASDRENPAFIPEPYTMLYQRSLYQSMQSNVKRTFAAMRKINSGTAESDRAYLNELAASEKDIIAVYAQLLKRRLYSMKIRIHGNYHLGHFLVDGREFILKDFEGSANKPMSERRIKRSPLRDVASMIHSIYWGTAYALHRYLKVQQKELSILDPWADTWFAHLSDIFVRAYRETAAPLNLVPIEDGDVRFLLKVMLLDWAMDELSAAIRHRSDDIMLVARAIRYYLSIET